MMYNMPLGLRIKIAGEDFYACAERALYWDRKKTLLIADIHLGKADIFRAAGISIPNDIQFSDIFRLDNLLTHLKPTALLILGDMVHGSFVSNETLCSWHMIRSRHPHTRFILTQGNHDRNSSIISSLVDEAVPKVALDNVIMSHDQIEGENFSLNISGHVHPLYRVRSLNKSLPAMVLNKNTLILPAFSEFTAGMKTHSKISDVWVFIDFKEVIKVQ